MISALILVAGAAGACGSSQPAVAVQEHAVLVHITSLPDDAGLDEVEDSLIEAIESAGVGEFDGNEIGLEEAVLYLYGPDGDALWEVIAPVLTAAPLGEGSYVIVRYGEPGARERRVEIG